MRTLAAAVVVSLISFGSAIATEGRIPVENRETLSLTIYADGRGAVSETRRFETLAGTHPYAIEGISRALVSGSLRIGGSGLSVFETTYAFDLLTPQAILNASVGKTVGVVRTHPTTGEESIVPALVLSTQGGVVLKIGNKIETGLPGRLVFDDLPAGLRPRPAVIAEIATGGTNAVLNAQYLTGGLTWSADYTALWDEKASTINLDAWATVTNTTGTDFSRAKLALVAGQPNRVHVPQPMRQETMIKTMAMAADAPMGAAPPVREALAGLHLYAVPRPVDLPDRQTKQIALLSRPDLAVERRHVFDGSPFVHGPARGAKGNAAHAELRLAFTNAETGEPLPGGVVRVFKKDTSGEARFVGEDRLGHIPAGEKSRLHLGQVFDVTLRREQTSFEKLDFTRNATRTSQKLMIRNAGDDDVLVRINERIPGDWTITDESINHKRIDGAAQWIVPVEANGDVTLTYSVEVKF